MPNEDRRPGLASLVLRTALFVLVVPGSVFVVAPALILRTSEVRWSDSANAIQAVGVALVLIGAAVMTACGVDFVLRGWGTPAPYDPTRRLVRGLLYARVRNPMYLGGVTILLGEALAFRSPALLLYAAIVWLLFHLAVVIVEEPGLRRRFGTEYEEYTSAVPRWLPRLRGRGSGDAV